MKQTTPYLEQVKGDTWCIVTGFCRIPIYLADRSRAVMIDSGLKNPDREGILSLLEKENIQVETLLTSHFHRDHIGNHNAIKKKYGSTVYMTAYAAVVGQERANLMTAGYEIYAMSKARGDYPACTCDELIPWDADRITVSGIDFDLFWLPGHAVEQVGFVTPDGVAYVADTLLSDHVLESVRLPYYTCCRLDLEAKASLRNLRCDRYILAHNGICDDISGLIDRNIANVHKQLDMVERLATQWQTLEQLSVAVMTHLGIDLNATVKVLGSKRNIQVLVEYLVESGRLTVRVRDGFVEYLAAK